MPSFTSAQTNVDVSVAESGPVSFDEDAVQEAEELKHVPDPGLPQKNRSGITQCFSSAIPKLVLCVCFFGRRLSLSHRKVVTKTKEAEQIPTVSVDCGFFGQPEDRAHDTLPVLIVRDRKSKAIWSHPVLSKGVTHPYPARALMSDLDFMGYKRVILKSDQEPSTVAFCDAVKNGWHGEVVVPGASPKGESKSNGEVQRTIPSVRGTCENSQRPPGTAIWNHSGIPKSAVGLVGGALFQSSSTLPQR